MKPEIVTDPNKIANLVHFLTVAPSGAYVEVGVFQGGSLIEVAKAHPHRRCYGYDTFDGMPPASACDNHHKAGDFMASYEEVKAWCEPYPNITLIPGLYPQSDQIMPNVALAHIDVDIMTSTYNALVNLELLMVAGGRIYCDDAYTHTCHGATVAWERFARERKREIHGRSFHAFLQF